MTPPDPAPPVTDPRRRAILDAAFASFCRYGFRRTTMEDIARDAGLSRAALYLHYRNKTDLFRALVAEFYARGEQRLRDALSAGLKPRAALAAAFEAKLGPELGAILDSPHGAELLDVNASVAGDIAGAGEARLVAVLAAWLAEESRAGRLSLSVTDGDATALAEMLVAALSGLKTPGASLATVRLRAARLAQIAARGLKG